MSRALQVYLADPEFAALRAWSKERGWTLSQTVRVAVKALTRARDEPDPLLAASGMISGLPPDFSANVDDYLALTFVAEPPARYGVEVKKRRRRASKPLRR